MIFQGIRTSIATKVYFCDFSVKGVGWGPDPPAPLSESAHGAIPEHHSDDSDEDNSGCQNVCVA